MRAKTMFLATASVIVAFAGANAQRVDRARVNAYGQRTQDRPPVDVWIDRYSFSYGERLRAYFQTDPGAYVTVLRVTTRGDLKVLYPHTPTVQRAFTYDLLVDDEVPYATDAAFYLNEPAGVGFVFAIASYTPFDYRAVTSGDRWSTLQFTANRYQDPFEDPFEDPFTVVNRFLTRTLSRRADYSVDYIEYEVTGGGRYRTRPYSSLGYDDLYFQCLSAYGPRALNYCRTYSHFGYAPYVLGTFPRSPAPIARTPAVPSAKTHPIARPPAIPSAKTHPIARTPTIPSPKTHPPKSFVSDPIVGDESLTPMALQPNPSGEEVQRVLRDRPRDGARRVDGGNETARRSEPRDASPSEYRNSPAPRIEVRREPRYEPAPQRGYELAPTLRHEPAPVAAPQPRYEPTPVAAAQPRYEPPRVAAPQPRYEPPPRYEAPARVEPRETPAPAPQPAPAPPPSPPPPQRVEPAPRMIPAIPPPPPPSADHSATLDR